MIGLSCTAGAVLALCGQVRGTLERKGLRQKELDGGRVRIEPRYNQGSGFGLVPLNGRQMAPLSLAALWALILWMILVFRRVDRLAAWLQVPYLLWVAFAGYLNWGVWVLNR